ncbi:hypothetical protein EC957_009417 [Mortierella hygrophila]|uniref:Telomeric repeat-binding factor 2-interacting protein 1 n=1 Tax=Mortierella hygrophila TaxID=979708 RepID=A0A9P6JXT4_9FUNG|nr:hypothetical protein EC957_009417 [Mortierella hygrophila]
MAKLSSHNTTRQGSEQPHQTPTTTTTTPRNGSSETTKTNKRIFVDPKGQPLQICVSKTVPDRESVESRIREYGGIPTYDESKTAIKLGAPGRTTQEVMFSVDWVDDCIRDQKLIELDTFTYRLKTAAKNTRMPFSREDDRLIEEFVKSKRAVNAPINGNKIYEEFAAQVKTLYHHAQHTAQSWRDRAVNVLNLTGGLSPYEASKAKREEARRQMQEKLAADRKLLEIEQKKLLEIQELRQQQQKVAQPTLTGNAHISIEVIESDSEEEKEETMEEQEPSTQFFTQQFPSSQRSILDLSDIASTDSEDRSHRTARDEIVRRRSHPGTQTRTASQLPKLPATQAVDMEIMSSENVLPDTASSSSSSLSSPSSPARPPPIRALESRDATPASDKCLQQDQDSSYGAPSGSDHSNPIMHYGKTPKSTDILNITADQHNHPSDADESDISEPRFPQPLPQVRRSVKADRARPATLSPVSKRIASPGSLQDPALKWNSRRSLPNRSWNQTAHPDERKQAGTPVQDDLVAAQGSPTSLTSPSLPTWRNSPQAHLSIPDTLSVPNQDVSASGSQKGVPNTYALDSAAVVDDTPSPATVKDAHAEPAIEDPQSSSAVEDIRDEAVLDDWKDDWQDELVLDDIHDDHTEQNRVDGPNTAGSHDDADMPEHDYNSDLTDEDDKTIEQRIMRKKQHRLLSPPVPRGQKPSSPILTPAGNLESEAQEERELEDNQSTYKLPAKLLLSGATSKRHQKQMSQTIWSGGMSFQFKKRSAFSPGLEGGVSAANSVPVSREGSVPATDGEVSHKEVEANRLSFSRKGQEKHPKHPGASEPRGDDFNVQVKVTETLTVAESTETVITEGVDALLTVKGEPEDNLDVGDPEGVEEQEEGEQLGEADQRTSDTAQGIQEEAHVSSSPAPPSESPKSVFEQVAIEASALSSGTEYKDVMLDYYSGDGEDESSERRKEREQLLLYLRDLYRKEIRTLMLHELVPALRSIDVLDACSGDLELAQILISKGMTEEIEDRFWTREDDYKLYSRKNEDVESLLGKHSAIEVVHRITYLTKTRQASRQFEVAHNAMEKSGLLKRARGRFGGRGESKKQRVVDGDQ